MKKLAIIGASYLQNPLILKAKQRGIETHVFAWKTNDVGEITADYFYPISIIEKDAILKKCEEICIDGICSIASDLASITVNYVATKMGLIGNSEKCVRLTTNKHNMRECFKRNKLPSPVSFQIASVREVEGLEIEYPIIVKPVDRSGSRGITKLDMSDGLDVAIENAINQSYVKCALVEEFVEGNEYSVECISWNGIHQFLTITQKYTTGVPNFIETGHMEPARLEDNIVEKVMEIVFKALDSLKIRYGASHSEIKISSDGEINIIEIGARMGGDCIGSSLVELSTGFDFVGAVIDIALGIQPKVVTYKSNYAAIRFIIDEKDCEILEKIKCDKSIMLIEENIKEVTSEKVRDSSERFGYYLFSSDRFEDMLKYMPEEK